MCADGTGGHLLLPSAFYGSDSPFTPARMYLYSCIHTTGIHIDSIGSRPVASASGEAEIRVVCVRVTQRDTLLIECHVVLSLSLSVALPCMPTRP